MRFGDWVRLVASGGFDISLNNLPRAVGTTLATPVNSVMNWVTEIVRGREIDAVELVPPVFVVGHWRTGTTLLQELLAEDPASAAPTVFQGICPSLFLLLPWYARILDSTLGPTRPFDNMIFGADRPQEDEFALLNLGIGSPYESLAYPNHGSRTRYVDIASLPDADRARWERQYVRLVRRFQLAHPGKRLILKSPLHTARVGVLRRLFPEARFIHISRDPFAVFPSTLHTFRLMGSWQGLHNPGPSDEVIREQAFEMFDLIYSAYERDRPTVPADRLVEIRYEEVVKDPLGILGDLYNALDLGAFDQARPHAEAYLSARKGHQRNVFTLSADDRDEISRRWRPYFERYGYAA